MPRYKVRVELDEYWEYVCEEETAAFAEEAALENWKAGLSDFVPLIYVVLVPDDTPLGDCDARPS